MVKRAVFLDRDGVLNANLERHGKLVAPTNLAEFRLLDGTADAVERIKRAGGVVEVYATLMRSHFTPGEISVTEGDTVRVHLTNIETTENATHTFTVPAYNIQATLDPGEVVNVEFRADRVGSFAFYCAQFCSALHMEMYGWLLVAPRGA